MTLITLFGLAIGVLIFINLIHTKAKMEGMDLSIQDEDNIVDFVKQKKTKFLENAPNRRVCPVCKTVLLQSEYLLCAMQPQPEDNSRRQVHIYGCPHCFINNGVNLQANRASQNIESLDI